MSEHVVARNVSVAKMRKVLVAGAGVGGLATALALRQVGVEVEVYEAAGGSSPDRGFVTVAANGMRMMGHLDALDPVMSAGFSCPVTKMYSGSGKRIAQLPFAGSDRDGLAALAIKRGVLVGALVDLASSRGARVHTGARLVGATSAGGEVVAQFEDGTSGAGDILVGGDGVHSTLRTIIDPAAPAPDYTGLVGFGGYADVDPGISAGQFHLVMGHRLIFGYTRPPDGPPWWFAHVPRPEEPAASELARVDSTTWKHQLEELVSDDVTPARQLIAATSHELRPTTSHVMPRVPTWSRDNLIIIGDAAHCASAASGQGTSMALEDAITLAKCLQENTEVAAAFASYERSRRDRVQRVVKQGKRRDSSNTKTFGRTGRLLTEHVLPPIFKLTASRSPMRWLHDFDIDWPNIQ